MIYFFLMIRVAIVDDHMVVRAGLKYVIMANPQLVFAGEHGGGEGVPEFIASCNADVTLMDVRMPDKSGIDALKEVIAADPKQRVVMLTTSDAEEDVFRAIDIGARGYVMKESPIETITAAINAAMAGEIFMSEEVRKIYETRKGAKSLSPRESEVLSAASKGLNNKEIGKLLGISENSVKMHLKRIFFKLDVSDRVEAVTLAMQRGIL
jgi:two-component system NarL family response regulator